MRRHRPTKRPRRSDAACGATRAAALVAALSLGVASASACGSRSGLDEVLLAADTPDASDAPDLVDAAVPDDAPLSPGILDAGREGGVVACGACVLGTCSAPILACVSSPSCRATFQCVATTCLSGGTPDIACALRCAEGDPAGALPILAIFQCVAGTCGPECGSVLGALAGAGRDAAAAAPDEAEPDDPPPAEANDQRAAWEAFASVFAPWPALCEGAR